MRCKTAFLAVVGLLCVATSVSAQVSNAGKAPETPAPRVRPAIWRNVGNTPCLNAWDAIYECPPPPSTVAIRAGRNECEMDGARAHERCAVVWREESDRVL